MKNELAGYTLVNNVFKSSAQVKFQEIETSRGVEGKRSLARRFGKRRHQSMHWDSNPHWHTPFSGIKIPICYSAPCVQTSQVKGNTAVLLRRQTQMNITLDASSLREFIAAISFTVLSFQSCWQVMVQSIKLDITDWCTSCSSTFLWNSFWMCSFSDLGALHEALAMLALNWCSVSLAGTLVSSNMSSIQEPCVDEGHVQQVKEKTVISLIESQFVAVPTNQQIYQVNSPHCLLYTETIFGHLTFSWQRFIIWLQSLKCVVIISGDAVMDMWCREYAAEASW